MTFCPTPLISEMEKLLLKPLRSKTLRYITLHYAPPLFPIMLVFNTCSTLW